MAIIVLIVIFIFIIFIIIINYSIFRLRQITIDPCTFVPPYILVGILGARMTREQLSKTGIPGLLFHLSAHSP